MLLSLILSFGDYPFVDELLPRGDASHTQGGSSHDCRLNGLLVAASYAVFTLALPGGTPILGRYADYRAPLGASRETLLELVRRPTRIERPPAG